MTKKELIEALSPYADDMEVYIQGRDSVVCGWYVDDEMDAPSFVPESEDPEAYDIGPEEEKGLVLD